MNYYIIVYFPCPIDRYGSKWVLLVEEKYGPYNALWKVKLAAWWKEGWDERWTMRYEIEDGLMAATKRVGDKLTWIS